MSDELTYDVAKANASECYNRFGFLLGGRAIRLDEPQEPVSPEPMRTQRRAVRLSQPFDREPDLSPVVQKAKDPIDLSDIDLSELGRWLSGDDSEPEPAQEPEPEPPAFVPVVELDRRPDFRDLLLASCGGQDIRQRPKPNSFVGFLRRHYAERRQMILDAIERRT